MKKGKMDWTLILLFSLCAVIMGFLSVWGFTPILEPFLWILFSIIVALVLSKNSDENTFLHGLLIGLSWGIINAVIPSSFFPAYLANNPQLQDSFAKTPFLPPRFFALLTVPIIGAITGSLIGGLALLLKKLW